MSRRATRLVLAVVISAVVIAAVALERMTAASAQAGMRRAPARRVPRPTVPTRELVTVKTGGGGPADTADGAPQEPPGAAPAPLSRFALSSLLATEVGGVWLDLTPSRPWVPGKGHLRWDGLSNIFTTAVNSPDGKVGLHPMPPRPAATAEIHVRPQVPGARYLVDCTVGARAPLSISFEGGEQVISAVDGHLLFVWDTSTVNPVPTEWDTALTIASPTRNSWGFYRCQLTLLGGPE